MARIRGRKLKILSDKEEQFVQNILNPEYGENRQGLREAYVDAGYADGSSSLPNAHNKQRELMDHIQLRINDRISAYVPWALDGLVKLATDAKNETVKLKALESILTRAGYNAPIIIENHTDDPKEMPRDQISKEINMLLKKALGERPDLKVVKKTTED